MTGERHPRAAPEFSVVIPSRNRPAQLRLCLDALARLDTVPESYEVIVVDDGSTPPYSCWLPEFDGRLNLQLLRREGGGPGLARNAGADLARGRFLALTDDDCLPDPAWLNQFGVVLRSNPHALAGGLTVNALTSNVFSQSSQSLIDYLYDYYARVPSTNRFFTSCNFALSAALYRQLGGFDPAFPLAGGEDRDFCDRWTTASYSLVHVPAAIVRHAHHLSFAAFLRQHFTYGRGAVHFRLARARRGGPPVAAEPLPFFAGMLAWPFKQPQLKRPAVTSLLIAMTVVMNILGFAFERAKIPRR